MKITEQPLTPLAVVIRQNVGAASFEILVVYRRPERSQSAAQRGVD